MKDGRFDISRILSLSPLFFFYPPLLPSFFDCGSSQPLLSNVGNEVTRRVYDVRMVFFFFAMGPSYPPSFPFFKTVFAPMSLSRLAPETYRRKRRRRRKKALRNFLFANFCCAESFLEAGRGERARKAVVQKRRRRRTGPNVRLGGFVLGPR